MDGPVRLFGRLVCASSAERDVVVRYLPEHIRLTRAQPGCLSFEVTQSDDPLIWSVAEEFVDKAAFDAHQSRTKASEWARQTGAIRCDYTFIAAGRS